MNTKEMLGNFILMEARRSRRFWNSSRTAREKVLKPPMFDKNTTTAILEIFRDFGGEDTDNPLMAA